MPGAERRQPLAMDRRGHDERGTTAAPPPAASRQMLHAIPANVPPPRRPPGTRQTVPELCECAIVAAERLRHASLAFASVAEWSPTATSKSWRRDALGSAITGHGSEFILRALAERAGQLSADPAVGPQLLHAAQAMEQAWTAWRAVSHAWDTLTTGAHRDAGLTPVAAELGDLVLMVGRLAYHNPQWTPDFGRTSPIRPAADLAPGLGDITLVLTAVHHAADAVTRIAIEDRQAVRTAAGGRRLCIPTRLLPDRYDIPQPYAPAPRHQTDALFATYAAAVDASTRATAILDNLAVAIDAPSSVLAAARAAPTSQHQRDAHSGRQQQPIHPSDTQPQPGHLEQMLRNLKISEPALLLRAAAIDEAASELTMEAKAQSQRRAAAQDIPRPPLAGPHAGTKTSNQPAPRPARTLATQTQARHSH
jgi:hypothetical protein